MATIRRKKPESFAILSSPGPWPQVLINWLATLAVIIVFGLIMLFSASYTTGYLRMGDSFYYIKSQVFCLGLGLAVMLLFSRIDHRFLRRMVGPGYVVCIVMLIAVLFSAPLNGCRRWLRIGFTIQVSEIAKFEMILLTAHLAAKAPHLEKLDPASGRRVPVGQWLYQRIVRELIVPLLPLIPVVILLMLEPHMSGIVLTTAICGTILLLGGSGGIITWAGGTSAVLLLRTVLEHIDSIPYLQSRLDGWTHDLSKMTDQTLQSLYAIGSGGVTGLGLGNSIEKQLWLPESTNDFIFSVVCEELGFVGAVIVILLFVLFLVQGLWLAFHAENRYCTLVGIGIMAQIAWQVFCNIAVVTNTLPNTGISLPFFSSGGTSLILLLAEMGVMINIGRGGERARLERLHDLFLFRDESARQDRQPRQLPHLAQHRRHQPGQDVDGVRLEILRAQRRIERHGIDQKDPQDRDHIQFLCPLDHVRAGGDHAVRLRAAAEKIDGDLLRSQTADQIGVDDGDLSGVLDLPDDLRDIADIAVKHEYGLDIGAQALRQPLVVAHSGDNGVALQGFIKSLFQISFRLPPYSGFFQMQKKHSKHAARFVRLSPCSILRAFF